jgi:uncharacterized protein (DUF362 family)
LQSLKHGKPRSERDKEESQEAIEAIGGIGRFVNPGDLVIVKPNLVISMTAIRAPQRIGEYLKLWQI